MRRARSVAVVLLVAACSLPTLGQVTIKLARVAPERPWPCPEDQTTAEELGFNSTVPAHEYILRGCGRTERWQCSYGGSGTSMCWRAGDAPWTH
jgi:hypothetical protein